MSKFYALSGLAIATWILAAVLALLDGPVALTVAAAVAAGFTHLAVVGMVIYDARS